MATQSINAIRQQISAEEPRLRRLGIQHLAVFGSVARGDNRPDSDIDIAVEIMPGHSFSLFRLEEARLMLEDALHARVDLGEVANFRPAVRTAFEHEKINVF